MPAHLHAVGTDLVAEANRDAVHATVRRTADLTENLGMALRNVGHDLNGVDLVALRHEIAAAAEALAEAKRLVDQLGNDWCVKHGHRGRVEIDGEPWRACWSGSSSSLKVADKARLADAFFKERFAPWLAEKLGEDPADEGSTTRYWLSLVVEKLGEVFTLDPKTAVLAEKWALDAKAFASPTSGVGSRPSFERVPAPPTQKEPA